MSPLPNAQTVNQLATTLEDGGTLTLTLLQGTGADAAVRCIRRVTTDAAGRLRSDIVYFYDGSVKDEDVEADFDLLAGNGLVSLSQLHHTESMLNRGARVPRKIG